MHIDKLAFPLAQLLDNISRVLVIHVDVSALHGLQLLAVLIVVIQNFCLADCELITFAAHILDKDGQMQLAASGYLETLSGISLLHTQADIRVQLAEQTVTQVTGGDIFTLFTGQRAVIYQEVHGNGRLGNLLERNGYRVFRRAQGIADMDVRNTGDSYDGTDSGFIHIYLIQTVKLIELADFYLLELVRIVVVHHDHILVDADSSVIHLTDTDTAHILVVVDGADQYLGSGFRISLRSGDVVDDSLEQRSHILRLIVQAAHCIACFRRSENERAVQLLVGSVQIHEQLQNFVYHLSRTGLWSVNLIDTDDNRKVQLQGLTEHELGLGHSAFKRVNHQNNAVYHFQNSLHLAAEIRMARGVDDIDFYILISNCRVLGQNGDASLTLNIAGVHDTLRHLLVGAEYAALLQKLVYQCGLTMVYMGNNRNISDIFSFHKTIPQCK